jgi:amino acid transporter
MGRDEEVPSHFGILHGKHLSPHRAIWTLVILSAIIGIITCSIYLGAQSSDLAALDKHNIWYSFGIFSPHAYTWLPNTFLTVTLVSNFGTFMLYMMTCMIAMVAFKEHHTYHGLKHFVIPWFGLLANLACMVFYLIGPISWLGGVANMSWKEPYIALGIAALWGAWGVIYFRKRSAQLNKPAYLVEKPVPASA